MMSTSRFFALVVLWRMFVHGSSLSLHSHHSATPLETPAENETFPTASSSTGSEAERTTDLDRSAVRESFSDLALEDRICVRGGLSGEVIWEGAVRDLAAGDSKNVENHTFACWGPFLLKPFSETLFSEQR